MGTVKLDIYLRIPEQSMLTQKFIKKPTRNLRHGSDFQLCSMVGNIYYNNVILYLSVKVNTLVFC